MGQGLPLGGMSDMRRRNIRMSDLCYLTTRSHYVKLDIWPHIAGRRAHWRKMSDLDGLQGVSTSMGASLTMVRFGPK